MGSRMRISTVVKARTIQTRFPGKLVDEPEGVCRGWDMLALAELHVCKLAALLLDALLDLVLATTTGFAQLADPRFVVLCSTWPHGTLPEQCSSKLPANIEQSAAVPATGCSKFARCLLEPCTTIDRGAPWAARNGKEQ